MKPHHHIVVALPSYNEATVLGQVIEKLRYYTDYTILIIDDGSSDDTPTIAASENVHLVSHVCNRGAGAASQTAIDWAKRKGTEVLVLMDADGQHHFEDVIRLVDAIDSGKGDIIIGNRFHNHNNEIPIQRFYYNQIANALTNFFCKAKYNDTQSGFRALNKKAIHSLQLKVDGFGFCSEMIIVGEDHGLKIHEVPINVTYNSYSMSKGQSFGKGIGTAIQFIWRVLFD